MERDNREGGGVGPGRLGLDRPGFRPQQPLMQQTQLQEGRFGPRGVPAFQDRDRSREAGPSGFGYSRGAYDRGGRGPGFIDRQRDPSPPRQQQHQMLPPQQPQQQGRMGLPLLAPAAPPAPPAAAAGAGLMATNANAVIQHAQQQLAAVAQQLEVVGVNPSVVSLISSLAGQAQQPVGAGIAALGGLLGEQTPRQAQQQQQVTPEPISSGYGHRAVGSGGGGSHPSFHHRRPREEEEDDEYRRSRSEDRAKRPRLDDFPQHQQQHQQQQRPAPSGFLQASVPGPQPPVEPYPGKPGAQGMGSDLNGDIPGLGPNGGAVTGPAAAAPGEELYGQAVIPSYEDVRSYKGQIMKLCLKINQHAMDSAKSPAEVFDIIVVGAVRWCIWGSGPAPDQRRWLLPTPLPLQSQRVAGVNNICGLHQFGISKDHSRLYQCAVWICGLETANHVLRVALHTTTFHP